MFHYKSINVWLWDATLVFPGVLYNMKYMHIVSFSNLRSSETYMPPRFWMWDYGLPCMCAQSAVSSSLWTQGQQPTKLCCPCRFPGKNTGVGCHSLLQGIFLTQGLTKSPASPAMAGEFFTVEPPGNPMALCTHYNKYSCYFCFVRIHFYHVQHISKSGFLCLNLHFVIYQLLLFSH